MDGIYKEIQGNTLSTAPNLSGPRRSLHYLTLYICLNLLLSPTPLDSLKKPSKTARIDQIPLPVLIL
jgi:hypothetical protein